MAISFLCSTSIRQDYSIHVEYHLVKLQLWTMLFLHSCANRRLFFQVTITTYVRLLRYQIVSDEQKTTWTDITEPVADPEGVATPSSE